MLELERCLGGRDNLFPLPIAESVASWTETLTRLRRAVAIAVFNVALSLFFGALLLVPGFSL